MLAEAGTGTGEDPGLSGARLAAGPRRNQGRRSGCRPTPAPCSARSTARAPPCGPTRPERRKKAVVRKGRENYLCLLNFQEQVQRRPAGQRRPGRHWPWPARWARATPRRRHDRRRLSRPGCGPVRHRAGGPGRRRPTWSTGAANASTPAAPTTGPVSSRRPSAGSRRADLVIANHALVRTPGRLRRRPGGARLRRPTARPQLKRIVFDEGHHLFDAADSAFSAGLSGAGEPPSCGAGSAGPKGAADAGSGLEARLWDLMRRPRGRPAAALKATPCARRGPDAGRGLVEAASPRPTARLIRSGPSRRFLVAVLEQLRAREHRARRGRVGHGVRRPSGVIDPVRERAAREAAAGPGQRSRPPLLALARHLEDVLDDEDAAEPLTSSERARIEGALRGLDRRARA